MWTLTNKSFGAIAVITKQLIAIFRPSVAFQVAIHRRAARSLATKQGFPVGSTIVENMINSKEFGLRFSTTFTLPAIGGNGFQSKFVRSPTTVFPALNFVASLPTSPSLQRFFLICRDALVGGALETNAIPANRGPAKFSALGIRKVGQQSYAATLCTFAKRRKSSLLTSSACAASARGGVITGARCLSKLSHWNKVLTVSAQLAFNAVNNACIEVVLLAARAATKLGSIGPNNIWAVETRFGYNRSTHDLNLLNRRFSRLVRLVRMCPHSFEPFYFTTA